LLEEKIIFADLLNHNLRGMKKILTLFAFFGFMTTAFAQSTGEVKGKITDEKGEGLIGASVVILDANGKSTGRGSVTDFDGNYTLNNLNAGTYNLKYSYVSYSSKILNGVLVSSDKSTFQNIQLTPQVKEGPEVEVIAYKKPLIDAGDTKIEQSITQDDIKNAGTLSVENAASMAAGVTQNDAGQGITINGSRTDEVQYVVNGHRMMNNSGTSAATGLNVTNNIPVPAGAIKEISVLAGGISAKYGDVTAGVVNITLQDAQESWGGNAEVKTTKGLDPFGTTRVDGSVYGPLIKIRDRKDTTSGNPKRTLLGFTLGFQYQHDDDRSPSAIGIWQVNQSTLNDIRNAPLTPNPNGGFYNKSDFITFSNMYKTSEKPNNSENNYSGSGEIGIYPTKNISIAIGGNYNFDKYNNYVREYSLLNSEHNPLFTGNDYLIYGRFTQRIGDQSKQNSAGESHSGIAIENASYTLQFDYEKAYRSYEDEFHGSNLFDYGYIGKFQQQSVYNYSYDSIRVNGRVLKGFVQNLSATDTGVIFTPSNINPLGSAFTKEYYQLLGAQENANGGYYISGTSKDGYAQTLDQINGSAAGLINGERSTNVDNLWYNVGRQYNGYGVDMNNQSIRGKAEGAFDIVKLGGDKKNTHKIEVGVEYEQRIQRNYSINPLDLWTLGRNLVNTHLSADTANPILVINGKDYTANAASESNFYYTDSIKYGEKSDLATQTYFDRNLRTALGLNPNGTDNVDFFAVDPSKLSLKLFSADELLSYTNSGSPILSYEGYDYQGNVLNYQPTVRDFFTQKNADGQYSRPIGAFMPIYAGGYIQDKFFYKDMGFVVGLRIDRYDANQEVLKDQYSLYQIYTAGQVKTGNLLPDNTIPSNIGSNYAVYVDKNGAGAQITGYRDGDNWYDKYGRPSTGQLVSLASSNGILPYINVPGVNNMSYANAATYIKSSSYDPSVSFTNYKAAYNVMPRLQYSFNITNQAQFFAHYDVLSQRPQSRNDLNIAQYYYFTEYTGIKNNPDLQPIKKTDYEFGFKQQVAEFAALTLSAFYQETRNLIDLRQIQYAFPATYTTYSNIDFRSAKGVRLLFDMRRIQNFKITANYTLQFVEGTGSDDQSALYLVSANQPNFRTVYPVSTDSRHQIKLALDYRFEGGRKYNGPIVNNYQLLANFGINLGLNLRSGEPTRESATIVDAASITSGSRGATTSLDARLPWYTRVDLRVNKDFTFKISKKSTAKDPKLMGLSVYVYIQNLLNTDNVLQIYPYTLNPNDDGYLKAASSQVNINSQPSVQAYKDLYRAKVNNPDNYALPRRVYLGASVSF
jgi:hypothetical protein